MLRYKCRPGIHSSDVLFRDRRVLQAVLLCPANLARVGIPHLGTREPHPLNKEQKRDPNIMALKRREFINQGSGLSNAETSLIEHTSAFILAPT